MLSLEIDGAIVLINDHRPSGSAELLARAVSRLTNEPVEDVVIHHLCPHCGSRDHGQPFIGGRPAAKRVCVVSFSRATGFEAAVARSGSSVGIDIETVSRISLHDVDDVLLHPAERKAMSRLGNDAAAGYRARLWVAKEAVLKSTGTGLRTDLQQIQVRIEGQYGLVESWPSTLSLGEVRLTFFDVSADVVGAVATR